MRARKKKVLIISWLKFQDIKVSSFLERFWLVIGFKVIGSTLYDELPTDLTVYIFLQQALQY